MKLRKVFCVVFTTAVAMLGLASCSNNDDPNVSNASNEAAAVYDLKLSVRQKQILQQSNDFAFNMLKAANDEKQNVFFSPYSIGQALGMVANGAQGQAYDEIAQLLSIGSASDLGDINNYYAQMNSGLTSINSSAQLAVANAMWTNKNYTILDDYKANMAKYYGAKVESSDFSDKNLVSTINNWSKEHTNGLIPEIVTTIDPTFDVAILLNSVYFKGIWNYFPKDKTVDASFLDRSYVSETVKMMNSRQNKVPANGFVNDDMLMFQLPYNGKAFELEIMMPKKIDINKFISQLTAEKYAEYQSLMVTDNSTVIMPRFKADYNNDMKSILQKLNVNQIFGKPDFSKLTPAQDIKITEIIQKATIEVNEEGTVASATTKSTYGAYLDDCNVYNVNRPFVYIIRERTSGVILFIGKVQTLVGMQ